MHNCRKKHACKLHYNAGVLEKCTKAKTKDFYIPEVTADDDCTEKLSKWVWLRQLQKIVYSDYHQKINYKNRNLFIELNVVRGILYVSHRSFV